MESDKNYFALITGASSGIGKAIAEEMACRQRNILLIALPGTGLESFTSDLTRRFNVRALFFEVDMTNKEAPELIRNFTLDNNLKINILINNLGVGHAKNIGDYATEEIDEMIMLNICSTTHLTNLFLNELKSCPESYILNMGSFGAFIPTPHKCIYIASKAYIYYFTCGLWAELENTSVKVCVAMPGPVKSNRKMIDRIKSDSAISRSMALGPDDVAKYTIPRLFSGEKVIIPGRITRAVFLLGLSLPYALVLHFMNRIFLGKKY